MLGFVVGQQVVYPSHGIGVIESIEEKKIGANSLSCYNLRLADANSLVMVPVANADSVGLRVPISTRECEALFGALAENFTAPASDWKDRFKEYSEKMKAGDLFTVASVLQHLAYLNKVKTLSFREQRMLEKAQYLVVSELAAVCQMPECNVAERVQQALEAACAKHQSGALPVLGVSAGH
jgi:CarD family transcriptional regulator